MVSFYTTLAFFGTVALAAWEGKPKNGASADGVKFLGCANEVPSPNRALTGPSFSRDQASVESCRKFCEDNNFWMFGVEAGRECFCGKYIGFGATLLPTSDICDMPCTGNNQQMCGGWGRVSIYNITDYKGATAPGQVGSYNWKSCYMEPMEERALPTLVMADDNMTVDKCMTACGASGFKYCGLEYGRECWGGNTLDPNLSMANDPSCAMQCDYPCPGNKNQMCGGRATLAVYQKKNAQRDVNGLNPDSVRAMKGRFMRVRRSNGRTDTVAEEI